MITTRRSLIAGTAALPFLHRLAQAPQLKNICARFALHFVTQTA